jgi:Zn-dependent protease with chaperone function
LIKNKFSRDKALLGVRKLVVLSEKTDQNRIPGNVKPNDLLTKIDDHFATHPPASERLLRLEKLKD